MLVFTHSKSSFSGHSLSAISLPSFYYKKPQRPVGLLEYAKEGLLQRGTGFLKMRAVYVYSWLVVSTVLHDTLTERDEQGRELSVDSC